MRSLRRVVPVAVLLLAPVLAGCGEDDDGGGDADPSGSPATETSESTEAPTTATATETSGTGSAGALPAACDVLTPADVEAAYGVGFGTPSTGGGAHTEQDLEWQSDNCDWEAEDLMEVQLALTAPDDFTAGSFTCPEPPAIVSKVTPVEGLDATGAWWKVDESPPLEATLRVCTDAYNFDIDVEYEDGVDYQGDPKDQTIALARTVLVALAG